MRESATSSDLSSSSLLDFSSELLQTPPRHTTKSQLDLPPAQPEAAAVEEDEGTSGELMDMDLSPIEKVRQREG